MWQRRTAYFPNWHWCCNSVIEGSYLSLVGITRYCDIFLRCNGFLHFQIEIRSSSPNDSNTQFGHLMLYFLFWLKFALYQIDCSENLRSSTIFVLSIRYLLFHQIMLKIFDHLYFLCSRDVRCLFFCLELLFSPTLLYFVNIGVPTLSTLESQPCQHWSPNLVMPCL